MNVKMLLLTSVSICGFASCAVTVEAVNRHSTQWKSYEAKTIDEIDGFKPKNDPKCDEYGGWIDTNVGNDKGFFTVRKIDGRWWYVDPAGNLFLSKAVATFTPGRSNNVKKALREKFGTEENWAEQELTFLKANGFNSLGCWSKVETVSKSKAKIPYTVFLSVLKTYTHKRYKNHKVPDTEFPRVFDADFEKYADDVIANAAKFADDKYLIGYFIDNELPWKPSALTSCLKKLPKDDANRKAAQKWFDARKGHENCRYDEATKEDRYAFLAYCVDTYLTKVTRLLRKYDSNHLFLGSRFNSWHGQLDNEEFMRVAGRHVDVVSINHYARWQPELDVMKNWEKWSGRPFMVTEFYTKGMDSGLPNKTGAGWNVHTQEDRGLFYENFVRELIKGRVCVGWQWFKYMDNDPEDLKADPSNRDSNKGIVKIDFTRYEPLLRHMKRINDCTYNLTRHYDSP